ncbi:DUF4157 domain-containing protein [Streptomyces sp. NPDC093801]|uniref:eCIS core domain-containing protein n=1 Tax=Streptomyces sp. NPDC093801 TaxID=3155203 RepID=UPI003450C706
MRAHGQRNPSPDGRETTRRAVPPSAPVQRMLDLGQAAGNAAVARAVEERRHRHGPGCGHPEPGPVQRREAVHHGHEHEHEHDQKETRDFGPQAQLGLLRSALATPSSPLPDPFLSRAKAFYRNDGLGAGRVHDNPTAQRAAEALGAHAVTVGSHILLGPGAAGNTEILAHEASHLDKNLRGIPETGRDNGHGMAVTDPGQGSERAATADGAAFTAGRGTALSVAQRAPVGDAHDTHDTDGPPPEEAARTATAPGAVQRTLWEHDPGRSFTHADDGPQTRWRSQADPQEIRTSAQLGVPAGTGSRPADVYDDATGELYGSGNASFSWQGRTPERERPERESSARRELVRAKRYIASALTMLSTAGDAPGGALLAGLRSGFPAFRDMRPPQIAAFLPHIAEVVRRIKAGLDAEGAQIALIGEGVAPSSVMGWVEWPLAEKLVPHPMKSEKLPPMDTARSGPIHLTKQGQIAWYFVHEATHRFAGTLDYQYSPRETELTEEGGVSRLAALGLDEDAARQEKTNLDRRAVRAPGEYSGRNNDGDRQPNWYAMGRRALMNADSYAQFILIANGERAPRY